MGVILKVQDLHLSFKGVKALSGVAFSVAEGEFFAVIGPNGAGKTTLLNVLSGVYDPDRGEVVFLGQSLKGKSPQERARMGLGRTFQGLEIFRGMSVLENVKLGAELALSTYPMALPRAEREWRLRAWAEEVLDYLHLSPFRHAPAGMLPYGLQKRVEVARALAGRPKLLLLDEPMAGMTLEEKEDMVRFILEIRARGTTVVLIEHDLGVVMDISDRVYVLDFGQVIAEGRPEEVARNPRVQEAYMGVEV